MKAIKIAVFLCSAILLLGLAESVHALSFDESFSETFGEPDTFTFKNGAFKFVSLLDDNNPLLPDNDPLLPAKWTVEATIVDGSATTTNVKGEWTVKEIEGEKTVKIEGVFTNFELTADADNDQLFNFYGVLEQSGLTSGTLNPHNPWFISGSFVSPADSVWSVFKAYLSNVNPRESGAVPEPATMMLMATGMLCIAAVRRKHKK